MQDHDTTVSFCPSFSAYSSDKLANIADKVAETEQRNDLKQGNTVPVDLNDDDFEFVPSKASPDAWQSFPLFNVDLLSDHPCRSHLDDYDEHVTPSGEARLRKLFIDDQRDRRSPTSSSSSSASSSDANELKGVQSVTYCVWRPKSSPSPSPSRARCQKSSSTGLSWKHRSWRFQDLLRRSRSDGKYTLTCSSQSPSNYGNKSHNDKSKKEVRLEKKNAGSKAHKGNRTTQAATTANEVFNGRSKGMQGGEKRKSYLPYRQDLFGFCVYAHGLRKAFSPF